MADDIDAVLSVEDLDWTFEDEDGSREWTFTVDAPTRALVAPRRVPRHKHVRVLSTEDLEAHLGPYRRLAVPKAFMWRMTSRRPTWGAEQVRHFAATLAPVHRVAGVTHYVAAVGDMTVLKPGGNRFVMWTVTARSWRNDYDNPPENGQTCEAWPRLHGAPDVIGVSEVVPSFNDVYRRRVYPFHATLVLYDEVPR